MTEQKQTSTERVKAHLARKKERKLLLASKGFVEVPLIVRADQVFKIENAAKMIGKNASALLYSITQPEILKLCQRHDEILIHNAQAEMEYLRDFYKENKELIEECLKESEGKE
jgi:hypothetical protein